MAREPYRGVELTEGYRPVAAPVDTFVTAQVPSRDTLLQDLARSLSTLGGSLGEMVGKRDREAEADDAIRGRAAFWEANGTGAAEAISKGLIPAQASPSFIRGWKETEGAVAGGQLQQTFSPVYDAWEGKTTADAEAFNGFIGKFLKDNIKTQDPDVLKGLWPHVEQLRANYLQKHIGDVSRATMQGALETEAARNDQLIKAASSAGLGAKTGMDYAGTFGTIETNRAAALSRGVNKDKYDQQVVDGITSAAIELGDRKILDFLDRKVPGADFTWSNTPYGQNAKRKAIDTIDTAGREAVVQAERTRREQKAELKEAVTRDTILAITKDPRAPVPEALLARGEKVDPDFRINAIRWRDTIGRQGQTSDPEDLLAVTADILNGGGLQRVQRGMRDGVFKNPEDLTRAYKLAEGMKVEGPKLEEMLRVGTAKTILDTLKKRTATEKDTSKILFDDGSMSSEGLQAASDYKQALMTWLMENPNAGSLEREKAAQTIGATFLERLQFPEGPMGPTVYDRSGIASPNTFKAAAPGDVKPAPAAPQAPAPRPDVPRDEYGMPILYGNPQQPAAPNPPAPPPATVPGASQSAQGGPTASGASPVAAQVPAPAAPTAAAPPQPVTPTASPVAPAAPPTAAPVAAQPPAPPAPVRRALPVAKPDEPAPLSAQDWYAKVPPETKARMQKMAADRGQSLDDLVAQAYQTGIAKGAIKPPPAAGGGAPTSAPTPAAPAAPGKRSEGPRAPDGTPVETASTSAATDPREEIVQSFRQAAEGAYVGRATFDGSKATLNGQTFTGPASPEQVARRFEGLSEADPQHRAVLTDFLSKAAGQRIDPAKVPWCAAFVDAVLDASGKPKRGSLRAADFLDYGSATDKPTKGDVVVFQSMARGSSGHVGFVVGIEGDRVRYIAGNDDNKVQEDTLPLARVAGFRRPPEAGTGPFGGDTGQAAGAFSRVLGTTGQPAGGYALPELKADLKAARILDLVTGAELNPANGGNYNAIFGNAGATEDLSKRTLDQTIAWSRDRGTSSSATGRYQFMADTMVGLKKEMGLSGSEAFTPELQDRMALRLLARRGYRDWATGKLSTEDFANNLAKEWAALPNLQTGRSHYAGDGVNKALVSPEQVRSVLEGTGAFPAARLASVAKTLTAPVTGSRFLSRVRGMFGAGSVAETTSAPVSEPGQAPARPAPLPASVQASHAHVLAGLEPEVASVVRRAQADNPNLRLVAWAGRGGSVEVRAVGPDGRPIPTGDGDEVGAALQRAAGQLGVGVNWASGARTLSSVKKTLKV